jgi:hypothetical protein
MIAARETEPIRSFATSARPRLGRNILPGAIAMAVEVME